MTSRARLGQTGVLHSLGAKTCGEVGPAREPCRCQVGARVTQAYPTPALYSVFTGYGCLHIMLWHKLYFRSYPPTTCQVGSTGHNDLAATGNCSAYRNGVGKALISKDYRPLPKTARKLREQVDTYCAYISRAKCTIADVGRAPETDDYALMVPTLR